MWTSAARAQLARDSIPYATCLTGREWAVVAPLMPQPAKTEQLRLWPMRLAKRSFARAGRCRWLARDHEATPAAALGFFVLASAMLLVRRLARES